MYIIWKSVQILTLFARCNTTALHVENMCVLCVHSAPTVQCTQYNTVPHNILGKPIDLSRNLEKFTMYKYPPQIIDPSRPSLNRFASILETHKIHQSEDDLDCLGFYMLFILWAALRILPLASAMLTTM